MIPHCSFDLHFHNNKCCWTFFHVFISHPYLHRFLIISLSWIPKKWTLGQVSVFLKTLDRLLQKCLPPGLLPPWAHLCGTARWVSYSAPRLRESCQPSSGQHQHSSWHIPGAQYLVCAVNRSMGTEGWRGRMTSSGAGIQTQWWPQRLSSLNYAVDFSLISEREGMWWLWEEYS